MRYGIAYLVTRSTLLSLVVLIYPLVVLIFTLIVLVYSLVILVRQLVVPVCPFICLLVVLIVLSVGLFIIDRYNDNKMIIRMYTKVWSIILFKQPQVLRYTLYLHDVQKLASVSYSSLSNYKLWSYLHCRQIK